LTKDVFFTKWSQLSSHQTQLTFSPPPIDQTILATQESNNSSSISADYISQLSQFLKEKLSFSLVGNSSFDDTVCYVIIDFDFFNFSIKYKLRDQRWTMK